MQVLLIITIAVLSLIIIAVAGLWCYGEFRGRHVHKQDAPSKEAERRRYRDARWDAAVRAARNRNAY